MGRANQKRRKGAKHQHLAKVGSTTENERLQHAERGAVLGNMGVRGAGRGVRFLVAGILVVLAIAAIGGLLVLTLR